MRTSHLYTLLIVVVFGTAYCCFRSHPVKKQTRRVCETRMPLRATKSKYGKNLYVLHFDPAPSKAHGMSVKYEQPIDEVTVQVWLLYHQPNFKYCTLFVSRTELRTKRRTGDGWTDTDNPITRCPRGTFQAGGIKM